MISHRLTYRLLFLLLSASSAAQAQMSGPAQPVVLVHADSLVGRKSTGEQIFDGHVRFTQGVVQIETDRAVYFEATKKIVMTGSVRVVQPGMTMTAPRADYDGGTRMAYAPAGVVIQDSSGTLTAGAGDYSAAQKKATFRNGVIYQHGSATLKADGGDYYSFNSHALFRGNVVYQDGSKILKADEGEYYSQYRHALFRKNVTYSDGTGFTLKSDAGETFSEEGRSYFNGNVVMKDASGTINAGAVDYNSREQKAVFTEGVTVLNDSGTVQARELTYRRDTRETYAIGDVRLNSPKYSSLLFGDTLRDIPAQRYTLMLGSAKMIRIDTAGSGRDVRYDTTIITARRMEAFRTDRAHYDATEDVRMVRRDMEARAYSARYFPDDSVIGLGAKYPPPVADTVSAILPPKDSVPVKRDTAAVTGRSVRTRPEDQPVAWYRDAQMTGDTMTVRLSGRHVRTVDVDGGAFIIMKSKMNDRFDQLTGGHATISVLRDTIRQVETRGNSASISFMYDRQQPNGANRVSGEIIRIGFADGQATTITVSGKKGRKNGEYFPEGFVAGRETYYRLSGFRWVDHLLGTTLEGGGQNLPEKNIGTKGGKVGVVEGSEGDKARKEADKAGKEADGSDSAKGGDPKKKKGKK